MIFCGLVGMGVVSGDRLSLPFGRPTGAAFGGDRCDRPARIAYEVGLTSRSVPRGASVSRRGWWAVRLEPGAALALASVGRDRRARARHIPFSCVLDSISQSWIDSWGTAVMKFATASPIGPLAPIIFNPELPPTRLGALLSRVSPTRLLFVSLIEMRVSGRRRALVPTAASLVQHAIGMIVGACRPLQLFSRRSGTGSTRLKQQPIKFAAAMSASGMVVSSGDEKGRRPTSQLFAWPDEKNEVNAARSISIAARRSLILTH